MIDFNELIDKHLERGKTNKKIGRYWPSEVGGCLRKTWFRYNKPKETPPDSLRHFEVGNMVHDFIAEVLRSKDNNDIELLKSELPCKLKRNNYIISGRVDDVILVKSEGKTWLIEVKSTKNLKYCEEPKESHLMQLMFYMHSTGIHNGMILYLQKDNLQAKTFKVDYDEERVQEVLNRFDELHEYLKKNEKPEPEAKQDFESRWKCRYCEYREECEEG
ncbi:MAG: CRISPR-associated protein Cas4 [archaeon]